MDESTVNNGLTAEELDANLSSSVAIEADYYVQSFNLQSLYYKLENNVISIDRITDGEAGAGFQRNYVWTDVQQDRLIESILLGLPVSAILLYEVKGEGHLVVDGQQRLLTIQAFMNGKRHGTEREFILNSVFPKYKGKSYATLEKRLKLKIEDASLPAIIIKNDSREDNESVLFEIYKRLNSAGTQLTPQEIRMAVFANKEIIPFLNKLNSYEESNAWRKIYGPRDIHLRDQEAVLRITAMYCYPYRGNLYAYLDDAVRKFCDVPDEIENAGRLFEKVTSHIVKQGVEGKFVDRGKFSLLFAESAFYGLMCYFDERPNEKPALNNFLDDLKDKLVEEDLLSNKTSGTTNVNRRHTIAKEMAAKLV